MLPAGLNIHKVWRDPRSLRTHHDCWGRPGDFVAYDAPAGESYAEVFETTRFNPRFVSIGAWGVDGSKQDGDVPVEQLVAVFVAPAPLTRPEPTLGRSAPVAVPFALTAGARPASELGP